MLRDQRAYDAPPTGRTTGGRPGAAGFPTLAPTSAAGLDATDLLLLRHLGEDARASFAQIGAEVSLSASAVKRRIDRLRARGVVRGFTVVLDPALLGWGTEAFVEIYCRERTPPEEILSSLRQFPEVVAAWTVTGDSDAVIHLLVTDMHHLENVIERIRKEPGVQRSRSLVALSRLIG
ncbi:Lrp/AsnC family transcriptional regulator [Kitasatospora sp. NPDC059571]|uniref:Lrp/AsnC family transcriptional regulator n=1 Tax=Kitasatospora sp. NPDC059571 TaxID=3346871 RepID=UPI003679573C